MNYLESNTFTMRNSDGGYYALANIGWDIVGDDCGDEDEENAYSTNTLDLAVTVTAP